jgi:N-acetylglutamate synthase-like GNAT family acetyltransferase
VDFNFTEIDINNEDDLDWIYDHLDKNRPFNINLSENKKDFQEYILKESSGFRYKVSLDNEIIALANFPDEKHSETLLLSVSNEYHAKVSGKDILKAMRSHKDIPEFHEFFIWDKENITYLAFEGSTVCKNKVKGLKVPSISGRCYCCNYVSQQDGSVLLMADDCLVEEDCDC